jgi:hypothetical protein
MEVQVIHSIFCVITLALDRTGGKKCLGISLWKYKSRLPFWAMLPRQHIFSMVLCWILWTEGSKVLFNKTVIKWPQRHLRYLWGTSKIVASHGLCEKSAFIAQDPLNLCSPHSDTAPLSYTSCSSGISMGRSYCPLCRTKAVNLSSILVVLLLQTQNSWAVKDMATSTYISKVVLDNLG